MPITREIIEKVAEDAGISVDDLAASGFLALLREKRRKIMMDRIAVLDRYAVVSSEELEQNIKDGRIYDHPSWEDMILLDNLESAIALIDEDIKTIQESY